MQIKPAPVSCYRKPRIDETDHPEAPRRQAILAKVDAFRTRGMSLEVALFAAKVPRSTYYRWRCALRRDGVRGLVPRSRRPGELVQVDHLSASRESKKLKEFKAVSPVGKQLVPRVYSRATAHNAKRLDLDCTNDARSAIDGA
ncbi:MAG: hypothetical protein OXI79_13645 [Gammaproteobacteria bacterium]|nr:hypothetical protein [Gammaproteobacteria bacterium]MYK08427.1 hypothetical protein [Terriglobia bacterium]